MLHHVEAASNYWWHGDRALANFRLVFSDLPRLGDPEAAHRLRLAADLLDEGFSPLRLMKALWPDDADQLEKYAPDQPRGRTRQCLQAAEGKPMTDEPWIRSNGGPLICLERRLEPEWGGISQLTIAADNSRNDYERACQASRYLESITLRGGPALIIGDAPLDTAFWRSKGASMYLMRVWFCEANFDLELTMISLPGHLFDHPAESLDFSFATSDLIVFDSAYEGYAKEKESIAFTIEPGAYKILTQPYDPDPSCSLVLHRFDRV